MPATIKLFGERNTSTNAVRAVIKRNSESLVLPSVARELDPDIERRLTESQDAGEPEWQREQMIDAVFEGRSPLETWKHAVTDFDDVSAFSECHVVFCIRHPSSWVLGLFRRPYHIAGASPATLGAFLDKRWKTVARERLGGAETSATALYNLKMAAYAALQARLDAAGLSYSVVRHEDFAVDQAAVFASLKPFLSEPASEFTALSASTKDKKKTESYYRDYYGQQRWISEIDPESKSRINDEIDWSIVAGLGYEPI